MVVFVIKNLLKRGFSVAAARMENPKDPIAAKSIYEFVANDIDGNLVSLEQYRGTVPLIVNVACECGLTGTNYKELVQLDEKYRGQGLRILAFPCNQFGGQEPGSHEQIKEFARSRGAKFDMFAKIEVNGDNAHPLYQYLKHKLSGTLTDNIKWNFTKFLVDRNGQPVKRYAPTTNPLALEDDIIKLLNTKSEL